VTPYKTTAEFDESSLPAALRQDHATKPGTWGLIRVLAGEVQLTFADGRAEILSPAKPGIVAPQERHRAEPLGPMRMQVEFYREPPTRGA
jgi:tellurite resistance-related uncharacterized protein